MSWTVKATAIYDCCVEATIGGCSGYYSCKGGREEMEDGWLLLVSGVKQGVKGDFF